MNSLIGAANRCTDADEAVIKNLLNFESNMCTRSTRAISELSKFIEPTLKDVDSEVAYMLLNAGLSSVVNNSEIGDTKFLINFLINYLVYGVGLENIRTDKLVEAMKENMLGVKSKGLEGFANSLYGIIAGNINECSTREEGKVNKLREQIINCLAATNEITNRTALNIEAISPINHDYIPYVEDWFKLDKKDIQRIKNFVLLVLKYYSGKPILRSIDEEVLNRADYFTDAPVIVDQSAKSPRPVPNCIISKIKGYLVSHPSNELRPIKKLGELPWGTSRLLQPYIMLTLYGVPIDREGILGSYDVIFKELCKLNINDLIVRVDESDVEGITHSYSAYTLFLEDYDNGFKYHDLRNHTKGPNYDKCIDEIMYAPCEEFLKFCEADLSNPADVNEQFETSVSLLRECLKVDKLLDCTGINVEHCMSVDSFSAFREFALKIGDKISTMQGLASESTSQEYKLLKEVFDEFMRSSNDELQNGDRKEAEKVNFVINYLWYSGCLKDIGIDKVIEVLQDSLQDNKSGLKVFAGNLCKLIISNINESEGRGAKMKKLKQQIRNCLDVDLKWIADNH